jgi:hypothetical protein
LYNYIYQVTHETTVEEVSGLQMIKVSTTDTDGKPQVITVFAEGGGTREIPSSLLTDLGGTGEGGQDMPHVIIQEITLPEGMTLDQGLVIANPGMNVVKRITPRGSSKLLQQLKTMLSISHLTSSVIFKF